MTNPRLLPLFLCLSFIVCVCQVAESAEVRFYVSPRGNDAWSGRLEEPAPDGTDGPLATLHACQQRVREHLLTAQEPGQSVTVFLREGIYAMDHPLVFTGDDSGTPEAPVLWRNFPGELVRLSGGARLRDIIPVRDGALLDRLPIVARKAVKQVDLKSQGIRDFGTVQQRGSPGMELFQAGVRLTPAQWPNEGWADIADVPQVGDSMLHPGLAREQRYDGVPAGRHYGIIRYEGDRPAHWQDIDQIFLHGYWTFDWSDSYQRIRSIDPERSEFILAPPHHHYGYTKHQRFRAVNVLEELDTQGEWFLNRRTGLLLFWPIDSLDITQLDVSMLEDPLLTLSDASWITVQGITMTTSRGGGVVIRGGEHDLLFGCTFVNLGDNAVVIQGGMRHQIRSCDIHHVARSGILLSGGNRVNLTSAHNIAENNHIHHWSRWLSTGTYAVIIAGVGNTVAHNLIHDAPFEAMYVKGNEHCIEYNEVHHVTKETGDAGALHTGRDWTWRGNVIRHNYFHDLKGPGLHGVMGVYLDDWASGFQVYGNLFYRAGRATLIGGGRDNVVENNVYIECSPSVHLDARGLGWAGYYFDGSRPELFTKLEAMHYQSPPYSVRYPELLAYPDDNPALPKHNRVVRNISWGGRWMDIYDFDAFDLSANTIHGNIIADSAVLRRRVPGQPGWDPYYLNIDMQEGYELLTSSDEAAKKIFAGNFFSLPPFSFDPSTRRLEIRSQDLLKKVGFKPLEVERMGLMSDEYRGPDGTLYTEAADRIR